MVPEDMHTMILLRTAEKYIDLHTLSVIGVNEESLGRKWEI